MVRELIRPDAGPLAYLALFIWPIVIIYLFRKLPLQQALIWSILGAYLLLPAAWVVFIDLPLLPALDKNFIPAAVALFMAMLTVSRIDKENRRLRNLSAEKKVRPAVLPGWLPRSFIGLGLLIMLFAGIVLTALTNGDYVVYGSTVIPRMRPYDALSTSLVVLVMLLPMLLGRKFLANEAGHRRILVAMIIAAAGYSFLALYEIRMSPQLNRMVYGFFPHAWEQHIRGDGFRPLVFMEHGLVWAIFLAMSILGAAVMARESTGALRFRYIMVMGFLYLVLILSKSLGALLITTMLLPVILLMPIRLQLMAAAIVAGITLSYPMLRGADIIPTDELVELVTEQFGAPRAQSIDFRFHHEDNLLEKANERPVFGWGGYTRWRAHDEDGTDITVSDGVWIITISQRGWVGYLAQFGFLTLPLIVFFFRRKRYDIGLVTSGLCVVIAANLIDLLPNSSLSPLLWLSVGALLGRMELQRDELASADAVPAVSRGRVPARGAPPGLVTAMGGRDVGGKTPHSRFPHTKQRGA
jgi:hypothetical protein